MGGDAIEHVRTIVERVMRDAREISRRVIAGSAMDIKEVRPLGFKLVVNFQRECLLILQVL